MICEDFQDEQCILLVLRVRNAEEQELDLFAMRLDGVVGGGEAQ